MNQRRHTKRSTKPKRNTRRSDQQALKRQLEEAEYTLHAQIGQLENFIAGSPFREKKRWYDNRDMVPPPDRFSASRSAATAANTGRRLSRREVMEMKQERNKHAFTFFCLFLAVCALLYWLLQAAEV